LNVFLQESGVDYLGYKIAVHLLDKKNF